MVIASLSVGEGNLPELRERERVIAPLFIGEGSLPELREREGYSIGEGNLSVREGRPASFGGREGLTFPFVLLEAGLFLDLSVGRRDWVTSSKVMHTVAITQFAVAQNSTN